MEIVPNLQRDKMSKEQIEYLQKQEQQYKYIGSLIMSLNRKGGKGGSVRIVDGGYYICARCGKKLTNWERF